jgi:hypothetical protein
MTESPYVGQSTAAVAVTGEPSAMPGPDANANEASTMLNTIADRLKGLGTANRGCFLVILVPPIVGASSYVP